MTTAHTVRLIRTPLMPATRHRLPRQLMPTPDMRPTVHMARTT